MRAKYLILTGLVWLMLGGIVLAQQGGGKDVLVQVREADGRPVKYACVTLVPKEGEIVFRKADRKGQVKLRNVAAGNYRIVVKAEGYEAQKREVSVSEDAAQPATLESVAFMLQPREASRQR